jgi:hypothetical protein
MDVVAIAQVECHCEAGMGIGAHCFGLNLPQSAQPDSPGLAVGVPKAASCVTSNGSAGVPVCCRQSAINNGSSYR